MARPVIAYPAASSTAMVTVSGVPDASVDEAKLGVDLIEETAPGVTATVGWVVNWTVSIVTVSVEALPAIQPPLRTLGS